MQVNFALFCFCLGFNLITNSILKCCHTPGQQQGGHYNQREHIIKVVAIFIY